MKEILKKICAIKGISQSSLSNKIGGSRGFVNSVSYKQEDQLLYKLISLFPDLNPYWLITGRGNPVLDMKGNSNAEKIGKEHANWRELYYQLRTLHDDVTTEKNHLEEVNRKLTQQIEKLLKSDK